MRVEWDQAGVQAAVQRPTAALVSRVVRRTENLSKARAPRDTGRMANSIGSSVSVSANRVKGQVGTRVKYALAQHEGASAHTIRPRRAKALRFYWPRAGKVVLFVRVRHPGVGATPFLTSALRDAAVPEGFTVTRTLSPSAVQSFL